MKSANRKGDRESLSQKKFDPSAATGGAADLSSAAFSNIRSWAAGILLSTQLLPVVSLGNTRQTARSVDPPAAMAKHPGVFSANSALAVFPDYFTPKSMAGLDPEVQKHFLILAGYTNRHHARYLLDLQKRTLGNGKSVLTALDSKGRSLAQNLAGLVTAEKMAVEAIRPSMRLSIVGEAARFFALPGIMSQAQRGTCRVSSPFWEFNLSDPGELSRLVHDLLVNGRAEFRWPGRFLELEPLALTGHRKGVRSQVENILYIAGMKFKAGTNGHYDIANDNLTVDPRNNRSLRESFFYRDYDRLTVHADRRNVGEILQVLKAHLPDYIGVVLKWEYASSQESKSDSSLALKHESHAVTAISYDNEGIIIRNPWGRSYHRTGQRVAAKGAPLRIILDPHAGIEKIPYADFEERLLTLDLPCNSQHTSPATLSLLNEETLRFYNAWRTGQHSPEILADLNEVFWSDGFRQSSPRLQAEVIQILMLHYNRPDIRLILSSGLSVINQVQEEGNPKKTSDMETKLSEIWGVLSDKDNPLFQSTPTQSGK